MDLHNGSTELRALHDLHRMVLLVNSADNLADVLEVAALGVSDVLGFGVVAINLLTDRGDFETVTVVGPARDVLLGTRNDRDDFLAELAAADEWGLLRFVPAGRYSDRAGAVRWRPEDEPEDHPDAWLRDDALYAPLRDHDGELVGIVSLDLPESRRRPGALRRQVLEIYVVQIGLAISRARERFRLQEQLRLAELTSTLTHLASSNQDLETVLKESLHAVEVGLRADGAWIRLFADEQETWEALNVPPGLPDDLRASASGTFPPLDLNRVFATAERLAQVCWADRRTLVISAYDGDTAGDLVAQGARERVLDWLRAMGHAHFVLVPIGSAAQCLGYLVVDRVEERGAWSAAEDRAALELGRELGRVIGNARLRHRERELVLRLEELDEHKSQVVTTVVHELKNPLAAIMGNLELVVDDPTLAERAHAAIGIASRRMLDMVEDMLTLTRLKEAAPAARHAEFDLSACVADAVVLLQGAAERGGVRLDLSGLADGVRLGGEEGEIHRLVTNLVSNAIKFSSDGDVVSVGLAALPDEVVLSVADTGLGIASADVHLLFREFERSANPAARSRPGTGLGLAISKRVVDRHGGCIDVSSRLGVGSAFSVSFPRG